MVENFHWRLGHFRISSFLVHHDPEAVVAAFEGAIVVRCEYMFNDATFDYIALHPAFELAKPGHLPNEYEIIFTKHDDLTVTHESRKTNA